MPDDVRNDFITYKIGDDRPIAWELQERDGDALAAGTYRARAQVRDAPGGTVLHEWSVGWAQANGRARFVSEPGATTDDDPTWFLELLVDDSRTWSGWERGQYDVYIQGPDRKDEPIAEGTWVNRPAISDPIPHE